LESVIYFRVTNPISMNSIKLTLAAVLIASAAVFSSCGKLVTPKKLDGDWSLSSGTSSRTEIWSPDGQSTNTTTTLSTFSEGTLNTSRISSNGNVVDKTVSVSTQYSFDKKTGEYSSLTTSTDPDFYTDTYRVYDDDLGNYDTTIYVWRVTLREYTSRAEGYYTINGNEGDEIEENSQVSFQERSHEETFNDTYSYYLEGTQTPFNVSGKYFYNSLQSNYLPFTETSSNTISSTGENSNAEIWNVLELNKDVLVVEFYNSTSNSSYSSSKTTEWTFKQVR